MKRKTKVGAFILSPQPDGPERLLLFTHPDFPKAPIQIPGGTVEDEEDIEAALHREIEEETGLRELRIRRKIGVSEVPSILNEDELLVRHCYALDAPKKIKKEWIHRVKGDGLDKGIRFQFSWHEIDQDFTLSGDLGFFLNPESLPELYKNQPNQAAHTTPVSAPR